jgi:hypothetical protein
MLCRGGSVPAGDRAASDLPFFPSVNAKTTNEAAPLRESRLYNDDSRAALSGLVLRKMSHSRVYPGSSTCPGPQFARE